MQAGMRAGLVIVLAVFLTGMTGFLTAVTPVDEDRVYYESISDLTPIMDYASINSYTEYNPVTNVSGWVDSDGVDIPFLESGISAYPYRHYIQSEEYLDGYTTVYMSALEDIGGTSWSSERANWYPLAKVSHLHSNIGEVVSYNGVTAKCISNGYVTIETDVMNGDLTAFSYFVGHYDQDHNLVHGFTRTYEYSAGAPTTEVNESITTLSALDNAMSLRVQMDLLAHDTGLDVYSSINVPLPTGHRIEITFITPQRINDTGIADDWLFMYDGTIVNGVGNTTPAGQFINYNGGIDWLTRWSSTNYVQLNHTLKLDGVSVDTYVEAYTIIPLSQHLSGRDVEDGTTFFSTYPFYHGTYSWSDSSNISHVSGGYTADLTSYPGYICFNQDRNKWYPAYLSENGQYYEPDISQPGYRTEEIYVVVEGYIDRISMYATYPVIESKYVDGIKFVEIEDGATGIWRNVMDKTTGTGIVDTYPYHNGVVQLLTATGTIISTPNSHAEDGVWWVGTDNVRTQGTMTVTIPTSIPYPMVLVTLDFLNGEFYAQGVVWGAIDEEYRNTDNWTLRPPKYMLSPEFMKKDGDSYVPTNESPKYCVGLTFEKNGGTKAYILNTTVEIDPRGILWGDPVLYIQYYFPDYYDENGLPKIIEYGDHRSTGIRVLFNGFVQYGENMTINGKTYDTTDGWITFEYYTYNTYADNSTSPPTIITEVESHTERFQMKGMAIEWEDGHVYLMFTERNKTRYDLGEYDTTQVDVILRDPTTGNTHDTTKDTVMTDVISAKDVWYWESGAYTINHRTETVLHLDLSKGIEGWGMDLQTSMLLFIALVIISTACILYWNRDDDNPVFGLIDWIIIGATILLSLGVIAS